jgi:predicted MFS family arabinose efflux permease
MRFEPAEGIREDARKILAAQGLRALAYGFASILLGASLEARGWTGGQVGLLLGAILVGTAALSLVVGRLGDRVGRRRLYALLFLGLSVSGLAFGLTDRLWILVLVALTGTMSTEVVESGPFTSLEQAMLPAAVSPERRTRVFGTYNAVATVSGSLGALAAGGPELLRGVWTGLPAGHRFFLTLVPVGLAGMGIALSLSAHVEAPVGEGTPSRPLVGSRRPVLRLSALFAVDSFGGGFVLQAFLAYWFRLRYGVSLEVLGLVFFLVGLLQAGSFVAATRLAERIGLLNTMVFTHLPSNVLLAAIPLAPNLPVALALLLGRFALSQMDVPARQAYVVALVEPEERTAAAAYTNAARNAVRPLGPLLGGLAQQAALGLPFFLGGGIKAVYDLALWTWFRRVPLADTRRSLVLPGHGEPSAGSAVGSAGRRREG